MNHDDQPAYGLWGLAFVNAAVFIIFALSFARPTTRRDWRSFGAFSGFLLALFAEMYGFPLTIYLLSGWLGIRYAGFDPMSHDSGHLWHTLFGGKGDPHSDILHVASYVAIFGGFILLSSAWRVLYAAQQERRLATSGAYAVIRHPQYVGFILIMLGFLLQWPTLITLLMFPILVVMYVRLAGREEGEVRAQFGTPWNAYSATVPTWFPSLGRRREHAGPVAKPVGLARRGNERTP